MLSTLGAKFLTDGKGRYKHGKEESWSDPCGVGLELDVMVCESRAFDGKRL